MSEPIISVCAFDDNAKIRQALKLIVSKDTHLHWADGFRDCNNVIGDYAKTKADVVLMDIHMPGKSGVDAVKELKAAFPQIKILMLTNFDDDEKVFSSICFGASGYLLKNTDPEKIVESIKEVYHGGVPMTPLIGQKVLKMFREQTAMLNLPEHDYQLTSREREVLECMVKGMSLKMICSELFISYDTIRTHVKHIYSKLHVVSMTEAVAKALQERLVK